MKIDSCQSITKHNQLAINTCRFILQNLNESFWQPPLKRIIYYIKQWQKITRGRYKNTKGAKHFLCKAKCILKD